MEQFNKEDVYDNEISPLMTKIIAICKEHKIPMLATFTYENHEERGVGKCTTLLNGFEGRHDESNQEANCIIRSGQSQSITMAIIKEG